QEPPLMVSVNLSGKQFAQPNLIEVIKRTLDQTHLDPTCLKLEITESVVMDEVELAIEMLSQMKALNVKLGIDDFGTGYSSLSYLHRFPTDTLKVDRSFVTRMVEGNQNSAIVKTIIALAHNLNMDVIAEGVETPEQLAQLRSLGCECGQGYFFAKPLPAAQIEALLKSDPTW
ncbi:MAG TPA: EAL domain-containing protein, partial [Vampirovibrionales bacterium]